MKILVIQKKFMGDVLVSSIVFEPLKEKFPHAELHYLIDKKHQQVVAHHRYIDRFLFFENLASMLKSIRNEHYDIIIDLYAKTATAILTLLSGASKRISFHKKYTACCYTDKINRCDKIKFPLLTTALEHRLLLLEPLGIGLQLRRPRIYLTSEEKTDAKSLLDSLGIHDERLVMISTFGSCPAKTYPIQHMVKVIEQIVEQTDNVKILCNYIPSQKKEFHTLYGLLSETTQKKVVKDFDTQNLREYMAVLSYCKALIGNEGGSTNISKALEIPTFSIYAPHVKGWEWHEDGIKNTSVHADHYQQTGYETFTPNLFREKLNDFIKENI